MYTQYSYTISEQLLLFQHSINEKKTSLTKERKFKAFEVEIGYARKENFRIV